MVMGRRATAAGFGVLCASVIGATVAGASTGWAIQTTPNLVGASFSTLSAVSCLSTNLCTGVGHGDSSLAERRNGAGWTIQATPQPSGAQLLAVACPSSSACTAVGYFVNPSGSAVALVERWNGSTWLTQSAPSPAAAFATFLNGVACPTTTYCIAVGSYFIKSCCAARTLAEVWNGSGWTIHSTPSPTADDFSELAGISCTSMSACTAVGTSISCISCSPGAMGVTSPLAERWDGSSWTIQSTPFTGAQLTGVSCPAATSCTAVGAFVDASGFFTPVAGRWNGSTWTTESPANPSGAESSLDGVSCTAANACTAVGRSYYSSSGAEATLAERWDGSSWAIQVTPNPAGSAALYAVSCLSSTACTAVGDVISANATRTVAEHWDGSVWAIETTPNPPSYNGVLFGVSCPSPTACTAVGYGGNSSGDVALVEHWNGNTWAIQSTPKPASSSRNTLRGVSCPTTTGCMAVGDYFDRSGIHVASAERWDGSSWAIQSAPNPAGAKATYLYGVSCPSTALCVAVGSYTNSSGTQLTLAERWNGTSWAIQATPSPSGDSIVLSGVSCASASACAAVGSFRDISGHWRMLAARWNGTGWALQSTPAPSTAQQSFLSAVSCASAFACTAVGHYINSSGRWVTLAERRNGSWAIQSTPNPAGTQGSNLSGVSCPSTSSCTAVGDYHNSSGVQLTLAERWNGTGWTVQSTANPANGGFNILSAAACASTTTCTAVGRRYFKTLAEHE